jgi:hypothetical protein
MLTYFANVTTMIVSKFLVSSSRNLKPNPTTLENTYVVA